jgi:N-acetylmuramoyl-L-alanine amidase
MIAIKQDLLNSKTNRPYLRDPEKFSLKELKGIIAHWTANKRKGADAKANRNYFNGSAQYASAHYIVDDGEILQCIPDNEVGYHVGAKNYKPDGEKIMGDSGLSPNFFLLGFEMCVNEDGDWNKTYKNSVQLAAHLLHKYHFKTDKLYRHFDITGKDCPKMMLESSSWNKFKSDVNAVMLALPQTPIRQGKVNAPDLNIRSGAGAAFTAVGKLQKDVSVDIYEESNGWLRIGVKQWVSKNFVNIVFVTKKGKVKDPTGANVRNGAGGNFQVVDALPFGTWIDILWQEDRWLEIGANRWVAATLVDVVEPVQTKHGKVIGTDSLNVRKGPDATFALVKKLPRNTEIEVFEEKNNWLKIAPDQWVYKAFVSF